MHDPLGRLVRAMRRRFGRGSEPLAGPTAASPGLGQDGLPRKAAADDFPGRFREIISDPLNLLIARDARAGVIEGDNVYLHNGNRAAFSGPLSYYHGFSEILIINRGVHEPAEEYVFQQLLRGLRVDPTMLELGAYWAHYSMWLKKERPEATTYMVEPTPGNLAVGRHNFALNGYEGTFIQSLVGHGHFTVDHFLDCRGIRRLDVLHADIQGFELEMLDGAENALKHGIIDYVVVSTHSDELHRSVGDRLSTVGYVIEAAVDFESDSTSYDGFLFARAPGARPVLDGRRVLGRREIVGLAPDRLLEYLEGFRADAGAGRT